MEQRKQMNKAMDAYRDFMDKRQKDLDRLLPQDPREESERSAAEELASSLRSTAILSSRVSVRKISLFNLWFYVKNFIYRNFTLPFQAKLKEDQEKEARLKSEESS